MEEFYELLWWQQLVLLGCWRVHHYWVKIFQNSIWHYFPVAILSKTSGFILRWQLWWLLKTLLLTGSSSQAQGGKKKKFEKKKCWLTSPLLPQAFAGPASLGGQAEQGSWHSQTALTKAHYTVQSWTQEVYEVREETGELVSRLSPLDPLTVGQQGKGQKAYISTITDHNASVSHENFRSFFCNVICIFCM